MIKRIFRRKSTKVDSKSKNTTDSIGLGGGAGSVSDIKNLGDSLSNGELSEDNIDNVAASGEKNS